MQPKSFASVLIVFAALVLLLSASQPTFSSGLLSPAAPLPKPADIACEGYERDTVLVYWRDTATDETNYRVERSIGGGVWSQVATLSPDAAGNYPGYADTHADVSTQNRRYRVRSYRSSDSSYSPYSDVCNNRRILEPGNFRVFYGVRSTSDDCPQIGGNDVCLADVSSGGTNVYATRVNNALQGSVDAFTRLGFTRSASTPPGSLDKVPINVVWCDGGGCAGGGGLGVAPALLETAFDLGTRAGDPVAWLMPLHEMFHFQQGKYGGLSDPSGTWVVEGQARSIQDKICIGGNRSTANCFDDVDTGNGGYVGQVKHYLGNANWPILLHSYSTALFWTYLSEKFGTSSPGDATEAGMNLMIKFWEDAAATPGRDGISVLNSTLAGMGYSQRFRDIWKDFAVASYAKDLSGPGVQAKYKYADMAQPGGSYGPVALSLSQNLTAGTSLVSTGESVYPWSARYYQVRPAADVPVIAITFTQDSSVQLYYTILGIKGTDVAYEYNVESRHLNRTLVNTGYDRVVVIVAGLENLANYRYSFNGTQPSLQIMYPTTVNTARVGSPSSPDKFRVVLEVLAADGKPLPGVNLADFSFRVGAQDVLTSNILVSTTVMGQQWFVIRAPGQSTAGLYNMEVRYSALVTGTQSQAVDYTPRLDADNMLLVDRSGSMSLSGKMDAAKATARLFVDSWRTGDKIGLVSFNDTVALDMALTNWTDSPAGGSRQTAFNKINALSATGGTDIGDALRKGWDELKLHGNTSHDWAMVLLSDGKEEFSTPTETFDTMIENLRTATGKRPAVHTVAVGPDADRPRMQRLASYTGGTYQYVSTPGTLYSTNGVAAASNMQLDLDYRYRMIASEIGGLQPFYSYIGPNGLRIYSETLNIVVDGSAAEMILSLSWTSTGLGGVSAALTDPANNTFASFESDARHTVWRVTSPLSGTWKLNTQGTQGYVLPTYLVQGTLRSDLTLDVFLPTPVEERAPGVPMPIIAGLTDMRPITGALVWASVQPPTGTVVNLWLFDDGLHGDGGPSDGIYGNTLYQTGWPGSYNVWVGAIGTSSLNGLFARQKNVAFYLDSQGDRDQDGLPDEWEIRFGTNPDVNDANDDPDNDGSGNARERDLGTDPHNPDTDGGGEADDTDPNPLYPPDDRVQPTRSVAYPGVGKIFIKYTPRPEYFSVGLYRGDDPIGPFTYLGMDMSGSGIITDTPLTNGNRYCYFAFAWVFDAQNSVFWRSANSPVTCATPKADPFPPHGRVSINNGAAGTASKQVMLTLWASDSVEPESRWPGDEILLPPPDTASGVTHMMISNRPDLSDGVWEPYATTKPWTLAPTSDLTAVYVKYRDAAGNESDVATATIHTYFIYLPVVYRQ